MDYQELIKKICTGNAPAVKRLVQEMVQAKTGAWEILNQGLMPAMDKLGVQLKDGAVSLPEVVIAAGAMRAGLEILKPLLASSKVIEVGRVVIGTVNGDIHSIGKELIVAMLESGGFEVIDLGVDVTPQRFAEAVLQHLPHLVALSGMLTSSRISMRDIIRFLQKQGLRQNLRILVGGSAVNATSAGEIGADAYGADVSTVVSLAVGLLDSLRQG